MYAIFLHTVPPSSWSVTQNNSKYLSFSHHYIYPHHLSWCFSTWVTVRLVDSGKELKVRTSQIMMESSEIIEQQKAVDQNARIRSDPARPMATRNSSAENRTQDTINASLTKCKSIGKLGHKVMHQLSAATKRKSAGSSSLLKADSKKSRERIYLVAFQAWSSFKFILCHACICVYIYMYVFVRMRWFGSLANRKIVWNEYYRVRRSQYSHPLQFKVFQNIN